MCGRLQALVYLPTACNHRACILLLLHLWDTDCQTAYMRKQHTNPTCQAWHI